MLRLVTRSGRTSRRRANAWAAESFVVHLADIADQKAVIAHGRAGP